MFGNFTEEARRVLVGAKKEMQDLKHPYVGSEHLLLALLKDDNLVSKKLKEYDLNYDVFREEIIKVIGVGKQESQWFLYTPLLKRIIENAIIDSKENNNGEVTISHLFASLLEEGEGVAIRIMLSMNIDVEQLYGEFSNKFVNKNLKKKNKKLLLEELGVDLTKKAMNDELDPVIGRDKEIRRVLEILSRRTKNNPILIGEAGVGKTAIVEELSRMIVRGDVPFALRNKRIISLDMASSVAGTKYRGEFEERMNKILKEIEENDDIILFIDEIHTLVGAGGAEGAIDASNIFKPALSRNKLRCIGATTTAEYKKYIENDGALERRFQKVIIDAPSTDTIRDILIKLREIYENFHAVSISDEVIESIINLSEKYIYDRNQPDKAIDVLDEVCAKVNLEDTQEVKKYNEYIKELQFILKKKNESIVNGDFEEASKYKDKENEIMNFINNLELDMYKPKVKKVTVEDVATVVSIKTGIPVYELLNDNKKVIDTIEKNITSAIIGHKNAVEEVINIAKRIKLGFVDEAKCYSIMFTGPSGVGKTNLAKIFGENLVGKKNVIRLDMSEFSEAHSVSKIVGAPPGYVGYADYRNILEEIRNNPHSVLILDEIEKAHQSVINLFFQILDEGSIKDSMGRNVRFDNVIIIMTSNVGFNEISVGFNQKSNQTVLNKLKEHFSLPFINRIDNIVLFNHLNEEEVIKIIESKLNSLKEKYKKRNVVININNSVVKEVLDLSNYLEFGARKIEQIIKNDIESIIIDNVINDKKKINIKTIRDVSLA